MVQSLGHDVPTIFMWTFGFGCALAGLAGVIGGNVLGTEPSMAITLGPIVFVVIVIGGLGSLWGALIAALFIGIVDNLAISYEPQALPDLRPVRRRARGGRHHERSGQPDDRRHRAGAALSDAGADADLQTARPVRHEGRVMADLLRKAGSGSPPSWSFWRCR